jgi:putative transposase
VVSHRLVSRTGRVGRWPNALAETINGLFETEVISRCGWCSLEAVELATLEWVACFNNRRLLEPIGNMPPADTEQCYSDQLEQTTLSWRHDSNQQASGKPGAFHWLARHPRWTFHFAPTSGCSWPNAVEAFFSALTRSAYGTAASTPSSGCKPQSTAISTSAMQSQGRSSGPRPPPPSSPRLQDCM